MKGSKWKIITILAGSAALLMFVMVTAGLYREKKQKEEKIRICLKQEEVRDETGSFFKKYTD